MANGDIPTLPEEAAIQIWITDMWKWTPSVIRVWKFF